MIRSEILIHQQRTSERNNRHQIRRRHLRVDIVLGRRDCMVDFVRLHGGEIEEQNNQPPIFELSGCICRRRRRRRLPGNFRQRLHLSHIHRRHGIYVLHIKGKNLLRLVIFENREVLRLQSLHKVSVLIPHRHVHQHQIRFRSQPEFRLLLRRQRSTQQRNRQQQCRSFIGESVGSERHKHCFSKSVLRNNILSTTSSSETKSRRNCERSHCRSNRKAAKSDR